MPADPSPMLGTLVAKAFDGPRWTFESKPGEGIASWKRACEAGIVGKRLDSLDIPGRGDARVKIKCVGRREFAIGGWTDPQRTRVGLGSPPVGYYDGDKFYFAQGRHRLHPRGAARPPLSVR